MKRECFVENKIRTTKINIKRSRPKGRDFLYPQYLKGSEEKSENCSYIIDLKNKI
jgi:hypothetical protein